MKNKFYLCLLALAMGICSCHKEDAKVLKTNAIKFSDIKGNLVAYDPSTYVDLDIIPRAPGENFTTYHCLWAGKDLYVNNVYWDSATYPSLLTGEPLYGDVHSGPEPGNTSNIDPFTTNADQAGVAGTLFLLHLPTLCGTPGPNLQADIERFQAAITITAINQQGFIPILNDYVASDYGTADCPQIIFRLKLMRSSTSSTGFAVADAAYRGIIDFHYQQLWIGTYYNSIDTKWYEITGNNSGNITGVHYGTTYYGQASGTYTTNSVGDTHLVGTFKDISGNNISFDTIHYAN